MILLSHAFTPIILYCYYVYITKYYDSGEDNRIYLVLMGLFLAFSGLAHPMGMFVNLVVLGLFTLILIIKKKKLPFSWPSILLSIAVFIVVFAPFFSDYNNINRGDFSLSEMKLQHPASLLKWYEPEDNIANMYGYANLNWGWWSFPFLLIGLFYILFKHQTKHLLLLSWVLALYLILHLDVLNLAPYILNRALTGTATIFYIIIGLGVYNAVSFVKMPKKTKNFVRVGLLSLFTVLAVINAVIPSYALLNNAYDGPLRITPAQLAAITWIDNNLEMNASIFQAGTLTYPKAKFMDVLSHRAMTTTTGGNQMYINFSEGTLQLPYPATHVLIDYSDYVLIGNKDAFDKLQAWEKDFLANNVEGGEKTLVYDANNIRIYALEVPYGGKHRPYDFILKE